MIEIYVRQTYCNINRLWKIFRKNYCSSMICLEFHTYKMKHSTWKIQLIYAWTIVFADKNKLYAAWTEVLAVDVTDLLVDVEIAPNIYDSKNSFVFFCIVVWAPHISFLHVALPHKLQEFKFEQCLWINAQNENFNNPAIIFVWALKICIFVCKNISSCNIHCARTRFSKLSLKLYI